MDSLTQLVLGGAVGHATLGSKLGRRALAWGALCGSLPDLDVLVPLGDAVRDFSYHRAYSHSLFFMALVTPLIVWLILKIHPNTRDYRYRWAALVFLAFSTHSLLDAFTVYGTQLLLPFSNWPVAWSTLFIIDPLYTLPLLIACVITLIQPNWHRASVMALLISSAYLGWSGIAKLQADDFARTTIAEAKLEKAKFVSIATPFNTLLWRVLIVDQNHYYNVYYSVFDTLEPAKLEPMSRQLDRSTSIDESWYQHRLRWFTKDFYRLEAIENQLVFTDLRMGFPPDYVFRFVLAEQHDDHWQAVTPYALSPTRDTRALGWIWRRIWDPNTKHH